MKNILVNKNLKPLQEWTEYSRIIIMKRHGICIIFARKKREVKWNLI